MTAPSHPTLKSTPIPVESDSLSRSPDSLFATPDSVSPSPASPSVAQLAWAAGFFDGEGCVFISKQRYANGRPENHRLGVCITQNDRSVLEHFRSVVGIDAPIYPVSPRHTPALASRPKQSYPAADEFR